MLYACQLPGARYGGKDLDESEYAETFQRGPDGVSKGFGNARGDQGMHNDFGNNTGLLSLFANVSRLFRHSLTVAHLSPIFVWCLRCTVDNFASVVPGSQP